MKKLLSRKILAATSVALLCTTVGAVAYAGSTLKKIEAYQNAGIRIEVDGNNVNLGSGVNATYPIVYNGNSYVPAKVVAEALGGSVQWDAGRQVVAITSGVSDANAGIPYKDNSDNVSTKPSDTASGKPSTPPATTPSTSASSGFSKELSKTVDMKKAAEDNKAQALKTIKAYAKAVATGDYSDIDAIITASVVDKLEFDTFWGGTSYAKETAHKTIQGLRDANKQDTLTKWNNVVQKASLSDLKIEDPYKLELVASLKYSLPVKGFDAFATISMDLNYSVPYKETIFRLERINFY
ncbi:stalk domain-containing protein [Paenibacillus chibensis]|uniref:Stalk domain-containing protein n=1 Tax=Paenibacillus chibensis TaxID=59846 RepID=A0ABU6PPY1_9BACL|nr:stalk domain-containing protein [Paenibacillus chibensis]